MCIRDRNIPNAMRIESLKLAGQQALNEMQVGAFLGVADDIPTSLALDKTLYLLPTSTSYSESSAYARLLDKYQDEILSRPDIYQVAEHRRSIRNRTSRLEVGIKFCREPNLWEYHRQRPEKPLLAFRSMLVGPPASMTQFASRWGYSDTANRFVRQLSTCDSVQARLPINTPPATTNQQVTE